MGVYTNGADNETFPLVEPYFFRLPHLAVGACDVIIVVILDGDFFFYKSGCRQAVVPFPYSGFIQIFLMVITRK